jgi:hypothetical protein
MTTAEHNAINQAAYLKLAQAINAQFPLKQFVALARGTIVADDSDFETLLAKLAAQGIDPRDTLIAQAGDDPTAELVILSHE